MHRQGDDGEEVRSLPSSGMRMQGLLLRPEAREKSEWAASGEMRVLWTSLMAALQMGE